MKVIRRLNKQTRRILNLMLTHGDSEGKISIAELDKALPSGWVKKYGGAPMVHTTASRLRASGRFDYEKSARANGAPLTSDSASGTHQVAIVERARPTLDVEAVVSRCQFCPCCGNDLRPILRSAIMTAKRG